MILSETAGIALIVVGLFFYLSGTLGLVRFPDFYTRLHALTKADNLGLGFVVAGLIVQTTDTVSAVKLMLTWLFIIAGSSTSCYLISRAAIRNGIKPWTRS